MSEDGWASFPHHLYTPMETVVSVINKIIEEGEISGQAFEVIMDKYYVRGKRR